MKHLKKFSLKESPLNEMRDERSPSSGRTRPAGASFTWTPLPYWNVWRTIVAISNGQNSKGRNPLTDAWDENGEMDPDFIKKLKDLKHYLNKIEEL